MPPQNSEPTAGGATRAFCGDAAEHVAPDASLRSIDHHFEFFDATVHVPS